MPLPITIKRPKGAGVPPGRAERGMRRRSCTTRDAASPRVGSVRFFARAVAIGLLLPLRPDLPPPTPEPARNNGHKHPQRPCRSGPDFTGTPYGARHLYVAITKT